MPQTSTVTSPAGEPIEVLADADWLDLIGDHRDDRTRSLTLRGYWEGSRGPILAALWHHGTFEDRKTGLATKRLFEEAVARGYRGKTTAAMNQLWHSSDRLHPAVLSPGIEREINGKRCYAVRLTALPQSWLDLLLAEDRADYTRKGIARGRSPEPQPEPVEPDPTQPDPTPDPEPVSAASLPLDRVNLTNEGAAALAQLEPHSDVLDGQTFDVGPVTVGDEAGEVELAPMELRIASSVASALLTQCIEIVTAGPPRQQLDDALRRLGDQTAESERLRKRVREVEDVCRAQTQELGGLRRRVRIAEANYESAMRGANRAVVDELVQRELDKVMRQVPATKTNEDYTPNGAAVTRERARR